MRSSPGLQLADLRDRLQVLILSLAIFLCGAHAPENRLCPSISVCTVYVLVNEFIYF